MVLVIVMMVTVPANGDDNDNDDDDDDDDDDAPISQLRVSRGAAPSVSNFFTSMELLHPQFYGENT